MFPTQSKANRSARLWLLPVFALVMLLLGYAVFAYSTADAQVVTQPTGDFCVEGIVINWEEKPLAGWAVTLTGAITTPTQVLSTTTSAPEPDDDVKDPALLKGEFEFKNLPKQADVYTAVIEQREGWSGVTPTTITFPIGMNEDDCVRIRFKMRRDVPVEVIKFDVNHVGLADWKIRVEPGPGNMFAEGDEEATNISGTVLFTLTPGIWVFMERAPSVSWDDPVESWTPVVPPHGRQMLNIEDRDYLPEELPIQVIFKNELTVGCIDVQKFGVIPAQPEGLVVGSGDPTVYSGEYGVPGWAFTLYRKDGSIAREGVTDAVGQVRFDGLPLGPYVLEEENRAGWNEIGSTTGAAPEIGGRKVNVEVTGNHCGANGDPIVFRNEQDDSGFCIEGRKIDANGGFGLADWKITIKPLDTGGYDPADVKTNGNGDFRFEFPRNDYRIPGAKYEICEEAKDGWLPHSDTCQTVQLPEWPMGECVTLKPFVNQQVGHVPNDKDFDKGGGSWTPGGNSSSASCSSYHVVKGGEGLFDIGRMYKKTPQQMLNANPDVKANKNQWVFVGQRICIP